MDSKRFTSILCGLALVLALSTCDSTPTEKTKSDEQTNKFFFTTKLTYNGDLKSAGAEATGLLNADAICTQIAHATGYSDFTGPWKAWLSDSTENAIDRINDVGPWYRSDGNMAFANKDALATAPASNLNVDENGNEVYPAGFYAGTVVVDVWTGTKVGGMADTYTCSDWTSSADTTQQVVGNWQDLGGGMEGNANATDGTWTASRNGPEFGLNSECGMPKHLYCIQQ